MQIDIVLEPNLTPKETGLLGALIEKWGLGTVWTANHPAARDPFMCFAGVAKATNHVHMGPVAISPYELHPLKMANSLLTLNELADGRAAIVVGGGGGSARPWLRMAGHEGGTHHSLPDPLLVSEDAARMVAALFAIDHPVQALALEVEERGRDAQGLCGHRLACTSVDVVQKGVWQRRGRSRTSSNRSSRGGSSTHTHRPGFSSF